MGAICLRTGSVEPRSTSGRAASLPTARRDAPSDIHMSIQSAARRAPVILAFVVTVTCVIGASPAHACDCFGMPTCSTLWDSDLVFIGNVERIVTPAPGTEEVTLRVEKWLRGENVKNDMTIVSSGVGVSCDYDFEQTRYLVFAYKATDGSWKATLCGGTTRLESAHGQQALREINEVLTSRAPGQVSGNVAFDEDQTELVFPDTPIPATTVRLRNEERVLTAKTDRGGDFQFSRVPPGRYLLTAELPPTAAPIPPIQVVVGAKACVRRHIFPERR